MVNTLITNRLYTLSVRMLLLPVLASCKRRTHSVSYRPSVMETLGHEYVLITPACGQRQRHHPLHPGAGLGGAQPQVVRLVWGSSSPA